MKAKLAFAGLGAAALIAGGYWAGAADFPSSHAAAGLRHAALGKSQRKSKAGIFRLPVEMIRYKAAA